VQAIV